MEYQVGDKVVYPGQGVSHVESISEEELAGTVMNCYTLKLLTTDSKVVVPVNNTSRVGLRPLADRTEVESIMERLRANDTSDSHDWKDRYKANLDRIKTGELQEIVDVLLCLADVAGRKTLSFRERKMFDHARQLLVFEVAEVVERPVEDVDQEVEDVLNRHMAPAEEGQPA